MLPGKETRIAMGEIRMGIPEDITLFLKDLIKTSAFIETGTYKGTTSVWASSHFDKVITIELSREIFIQTKSLYQYIGNIEFVYGDSRKELKRILNEFNQSAIFWLDAHWCDLDSYGENDQCPLIDELEIICSSSGNHVILIDDARLFLSPPPFPNIIKFYPTISEVIFKVMELMDAYIIVYEDVIFCIPKMFKKEFESFMQQKATYNEKIRKALQEREEKKKILIRKLKRKIGRAHV